MDEDIKMCNCCCKELKDEHRTKFYNDNEKEICQDCWDNGE